MRKEFNTTGSCNPERWALLVTDGGNVGGLSVAVEIHADLCFISLQIASRDATCQFKDASEGIDIHVR